MESLASTSVGFAIGDFINATKLATETLGLLTASENEANQDSVVILSFRSLQAQRIKELQQDLYKISLDRVEVLGSPPPESNADDRRHLRDINTRLDTVLNSYAEAIRNYETLSQEAFDPSSPNVENRLRRITRRIFGLPQPNDDFSVIRKLLTDPNQNFNFRELNREVREAKRRRQAFSERIWMGALGGVAVIGPMLLMSLHRTLTTSLVTSSVATVLFTLVLALGARNLKGQEVQEQLLLMRLCWWCLLGRV